MRARRLRCRPQVLTDLQGCAAPITWLCRTLQIVSCVSACYAGARVTSEVARLEGLTVSGPTLLSLQLLPSAPPMSSPFGTDSKDRQQNAAGAARPPPELVDTARHVGPAQSATYGPGFAAPHVDSPDERQAQHHTAKVMRLPTSAGTARTGQGPSSGVSAASSSPSAGQQHNPAATTTPANMAYMERPPEDVPLRQSDGGSCDSHVDNEPTVVSGAPQDYHPVIRNPLAGKLHQGKLAGVRSSWQVLAIFAACSPPPGGTVQSSRAHSHCDTDADDILRDSPVSQYHPMIAPQSMLLRRIVTPGSGTSLHRALSTGACDGHCLGLCCADHHRRPLVAAC